MNSSISYTIDVSDATVKHKDLVFLQALRTIIKAHWDVSLSRDDIIALLKYEVQQMEKQKND